MAKDSGYPPKDSTNSARVQVIITKNRQAPQFTQRDYSLEVPETTQTGASVLDIQAVDNDPPGPFNTVSYSLIGDDAATSFFGVDEKSGRVTVKRDLRTENVEFYTVS